MKAKNFGLFALASFAVLGLASCGSKYMTHDEYIAAENDAEVFIDGYVQAVSFNAEYKNANLYIQDDNGAYFAYRAAAEKATDFVVGSHVSVKGTKAAWAGQVEIADPEVTVVDNKTKTYEKVTLNAAQLETHKNELVSVAGLTVMGVTAPKATGGDIYYDVTDGTTAYTFVVETDLTSNTSTTYSTVLGLKIGDVVTVEGYNYTYNAPQIQTTAITVTEASKAMTAAEYNAAAKDADVTVMGFIQGVSYSSAYGNANLYIQSYDGAYFVYRIACTSETQYKLGSFVTAKGTKSEWSGQVEITDTTLTTIGTVTKTFATTETTLAGLANYKNEMVKVAGLKVTKVTAPKSEGGDIYFDVTDGTLTYTFVVESDLRGANTDCYKAGLALQVNDVITVEGFNYTYKNPQIQCTTITK